MNALNNIKIGTKLIGAFLLLVVIMAVVGLVGISNMQTIDQAEVPIQGQRKSNQRDTQHDGRILANELLCDDDRRDQ